MAKKIILCIETGTDICSAALSEEGKLIALRESREGNDHARNIGVFVDEMLRENDLLPEDLAAVAIGRGPGSYTGLRIGTAFAKGFCYALNIPLLAIDSLESLARIACEDYEVGTIESDDWAGALLCPMIDARRMEVFCSVYDTALNSVSGVEAKIIDESSFSDLLSGGKDFFIFGSGAKKCQEVMGTPNVKFVEVSPSARGLCAAAYEKFLREEWEDIAYFEPFYLKDFVVTKSKKNLLEAVAKKPKREAEQQ